MTLYCPVCAADDSQFPLWLDKLDTPAIVGGHFTVEFDDCRGEGRRAKPLADLSRRLRERVTR